MIARTCTETRSFLDGHRDNAGHEGAMRRPRMTAGGWRRNQAAPRNSSLSPPRLRAIGSRVK